MGDWIYYVRGLGVWSASVLAGYVFVNHDPASVVTSLIGGTVTLTGIGFLIWKLVADHTIEAKQRDTYDRIIDQLQDELERTRQAMNEAIADARKLAKELAQAKEET